MPIQEHELHDIRRRVLAMFMDTIASFEQIEKHAEDIFGDSAADIRGALNECLDDFVRRTDRSGQPHPETIIFVRATAADFQRAGIYGRQLALKELQVSAANNGLRNALANLGFGDYWKKRFLKWIDVINNFMGSLVSGLGLAEALKELKDCLRDGMPD